MAQANVRPLNPSRERQLKLLTREREARTIARLEARIKELEGDLMLQSDALQDIQEQIAEANRGRTGAEQALREAHNRTGTAMADIAAMREQLVGTTTMLDVLAKRESPSVDLSGVLENLRNVEEKVAAVMIEARKAATREINIPTPVAPQPTGDLRVIVHRDEAGRVTDMIITKRS